jgi:hypothetical protein
MNKQPFTIGGSIALKKALLEEAGLNLHTQTCAAIADNNKESMGKHHLECVYDATRECQYISLDPTKNHVHYHLPQDWDNAVAAVKDFFAEEPTFEKGKWYYAKEFDEASIYKFSRFDDNIPEFSEVIELSKNGRVLTYTNQRVFNSTISLMQPATKEQIQEMLGKVAEQKGFLEGAVVNSIHVNNVPLGKGSYVYHAAVDVLYFSGRIIYEKGKWAELLPQEEPKPETLLLKGVFVEDSSWADEVDLHLTPAHLQQLKAYFNK